MSFTPDAYRLGQWRAAADAAARLDDPPPPPPDPQMKLPFRKVRVSAIARCTQCNHLYLRQKGCRCSRIVLPNLSSEPRAGEVTHG